MAIGPEPKQGLNILYVGTLPPHPGGSAISCFQLLAGFAGLGHSVRALAPITPEALRSGDLFAASYPNIHVTRFLVPYFDNALPIPSAAEYREVERAQIQEKLPLLISSNRPDVVLIGRESFAWEVPGIAMAHSIPSIMLIRGGSRTARLLNGRYPDDLAHRLLVEYRKVNLIVAVAKHLTEGLQRLGFERVKTIPNAVNLRQFSPKPKNVALLRKLAIKDDDVVVMHVANLQMRKRSLNLVSSSVSALQQDRRLVYVIVGDGPLRETMENTCREKQISEKFRFVGWIEYDRMPDYINLADIVVMPSEAEGMARVYLETQACARVLLASDIPAAREVIVDGETGLLFSKGDIDDLTAKTLLAASDPKFRGDIGRKAREQVKGHSLIDAVTTFATTMEDAIRQHRESLSDRAVL